MSYTNSTPNTGNSLNFTRDLINTNFSEIFDVNGKNHEDFNTANKGKHKFLQMPEQSSAPTTAADEAGFYAKVGTSPAESNLFFRGEGDGQEYQLTKADSANLPTFAVNDEYDAGPPSLLGGWSFLPGGLIMQWGTYDTATSTTSFVVTFPKAFPTAVFNIQVTGLRAASSPGTNTDAWVATGFTTSGFTIFNNGGHNFKYMWQAIGN